MYYVHTVACRFDTIICCFAPLVHQKVDPKFNVFSWLRWEIPTLFIWCVRKNQRSAFDALGRISNQQSAQRISFDALGGTSDHHSVRWAESAITFDALSGISDQFQRVGRIQRSTNPPNVSPFLRRNLVCVHGRVVLGQFCDPAQVFRKNRPVVFYTTFFFRHALFWLVSLMQGHPRCITRKMGSIKQNNSIQFERPIHNGLLGITCNTFVLPHTILSYCVKLILKSSNSR